MCSNNKTTTYIKNYLDKIETLKTWIKEADAVVIGAGAGLSTSAGFAYDGERFDKIFSDFKNEYGICDMYSGGFYPFETLEEYWGWWSRHIYYNRYVEAPKPVYHQLFELVKDKDYFVITTNVDHQFQKAGFDKNRLFYTQGDYGLLQCSIPCHKKTYDNETSVIEMMKKQKDRKIPSELIPVCPVCGNPMTMNLRSDETFVEDEGWHQACKRYEVFINDHKDKKVLYFELGIGGNTPAIIKFPFWQFTFKNEKARYVCVNLKQVFAPKEINGRALCISADIGEVIKRLMEHEV